MSQSTPTQEVTKAPKTVPLREALPWFIVAIMIFAIAGIISGWFFRSQVTASNQAAIAAVSKIQAR